VVNTKNSEESCEIYVLKGVSAYDVFIHPYGYKSRNELDGKTGSVALSSVEQSSEEYDFDSVEIKEDTEEDNLKGLKTFKYNTYTFFFETKLDNR
jgi:hypothetical protein